MKLRTNRIAVQPLIASLSLESVFDIKFREIMSKVVKAVTIRDAPPSGLKPKQPQRQESSSSNASSSSDAPHGAGLPANNSTSSLSGLMNPPSRSDSSCSTNGRVPCIPIPVNRPEMDMMCPLSPTGLSLKATRPPADESHQVSTSHSGGPVSNIWTPVICEPPSQK